MIREGSGEPLVLLHGIINSERVWGPVVPLLAPDFDTIALTALGHHGGTAATEHPVNLDHLVDRTEAQLDELGLQKVHVAGNSLGGWMALELARRGRASSVCALSPAGFWEEGWPAVERSFNVLLAARRDARRGRHVARVLSRSPRFRRWAMREACLHGDRVPREQFLGFNEDIRGCDVAEELIQPGKQFEELEPDCPVTIAWAAEDRLFPLSIYEERGRSLVKGARFLVLEDVGHVPMNDDPQLVAETIRESTRASASDASLSSPRS